MTTPDLVPPAVDAATFRATLSRVPTAVVVVTAPGGSDGPAAMVVGTFTSVSLDPPLVGFLPDRSSSSWPRIAAAGTFCANVLAADQAAVSNAFASRSGGRFGAVSWQPGPTGPVLDGVVATVSCTIERVEDAGDHWWVMGRVVALDVHRADVAPMVFLGGAYGSFVPLAGPG